MRNLYMNKLSRERKIKKIVNKIGHSLVMMMGLCTIAICTKIALVNVALTFNVRQWIVIAVFFVIAIVSGIIEYLEEIKR